MYRTAVIIFAGKNIGLGWESIDFSKFRLLGLQKFGVYMGNNGSVYITDSATRVYQVGACLFEYLSPINLPELAIEGAESCELLEKKIINEFIPSKKRNEYARQRRIFFKALIEENEASPENIEAYCKVLTMLEGLIPNL